MSSYGVMRQVQQWYIDREQTGWVASASVDEILEKAQFDLTREEAQALHDHRIDVLADEGVHAFALIQTSRVFGFDIGQRWTELGARPAS